MLETVLGDIRRQLPDEVMDELLAGTKTEEEIVGTGWVAIAVDQADGGAGARGGRAHGPPRL